MTLPIRINRINPASLRNLQAYVRDVPDRVSKQGSRAIKRGAEMYAEALEENIRTQRFAGMYSPLDPEYVMRKIRKGKTGDYPAFWMFDEELVSAIQVNHRSTGGDNKSFVVGFADTQHSSGLSNKELAMILEYGHGVPPRPVVEPTWEEHKYEIKEEVKRIFKADWNKYKF